MTISTLPLTKLTRVSLLTAVITDGTALFYTLRHFLYIYIFFCSRTDCSFPLFGIHLGKRDKLLNLMTYLLPFPLCKTKRKLSTKLLKTCLSELHAAVSEGLGLTIDQHSPHSSWKNTPIKTCVLWNITLLPSSTLEVKGTQKARLLILFMTEELIQDWICVPTPN